MRFIVLAVVLLAGSVRSELDSLIQAERAFARLSVAKGTRDAFLATLSNESILFRPGAVPGKSWTEKSAPSAAQLNWEPAFADIAKAGDLGYTTGPWEIRRTPQDPPAGFGHYVTVWKKQADGAWKIAIDIGIGHTAGPKPKSVESPKLASEIQKTLSETEIQAARGVLLDAENHFPLTAGAYPSMLADDARLYRDNSFPFVGKAAVRKALSERNGTFVWKVANAEVSGSADLAYSYGTVEFRSADSSKPVESANYLRIWKKQKSGAWKVVLDLVA